MPDHDGLYHRLFNDPRLVADLLTEFVLNPANHIAWQGLGGALMQIGWLSDAIGAKPDLAAARYNLGLALETQGNQTLALAAPRRCDVTQAGGWTCSDRPPAAVTVAAPGGDRVPAARRRCRSAHGYRPPVAGQGPDGGGEAC